MSARPRGRAKRAWGVPRSSAGSEGVKKSRKWVATVRKIRTLQHVANPISEFLHTLSAGATRFWGMLEGASAVPFDHLDKSERKTTCLHCPSDGSDGQGSR